MCKCVRACVSMKHLGSCLTNLATHVSVRVCVCTRACTLVHRVNHVKIFKGWPLRDAPLKLVQLLYKTYSSDHDDQVEMKTPTRLSNKTGTA